MPEEPKALERRAADAFAELVGVVRRLRAPGGCPWDREQTHESLRTFIVEEAYEVVEAIDRSSAPDLAEELGDLLLQIALQAEIARQSGAFDIEDVVRGLSGKLVRRHPHVFGDARVDGADEVLSSWERIKKGEKRDRGLLDGLPISLPALQRAARMGEKAGRVGFDWPDAASVRDKVVEELAEVDAAVSEGREEEIEREIGDLLFAIAQWARHLGRLPEEALRAACSRFGKRFARMERSAEADGRTLSEMGPDDLDLAWRRVKEAEG